MKSTGITRNPDSLGRIVIPMEMRRNMEITEDTPLEIFVNGNDIVLRKYKPGCALCNSTDGLAEINGTRVCAECRDALNKFRYALLEVINENN